MKQFGKYDSNLREAGTLAQCSKKWLVLMVLDLTSLKLTAAALNQLVQNECDNLRPFFVVAYMHQLHAMCCKSENGLS